MFFHNFFNFKLKPKTVHLNDDCLIYILVCLPLVDLLRMQLIFRRWKLLVRHAALGKRCIKLHHKRDYDDCVFHEQYDDVYFGRENYLKRDPFEVLIVGDLTTNRRLELLVRTFANITSLEIRQINPKAVNRHLLCNWSKLCTLKLFVGDSSYGSETTSEEWNCWLGHISRKLTSQKHLVVYESSAHLRARIRFPANFCPQLESLHCGLLFEEANIAMGQIAQMKCLRTFGFIPYHSYNNHQCHEGKDQYKRVLLTKFSSPLNELMLRNEFDCNTREWVIQCAFYRNYSTLTHLSLHICKPLHWLMLDSGLHNLANLAYLNVQNLFLNRTHIGIPLRRGLWCTKPDSNPCYPSLRTLHLAHVPSYAFNWALTALPHLETLQMDRQILTDNLNYSPHSTGGNTFASLYLLKVFTKLRQIIYLDRVYPTEPVLNIVYTHKI